MFGCMGIEHPRRGHAWHAVAGLDGRHVHLPVHGRNGLPAVAWIPTDLEDHWTDDGNDEDETDAVVPCRGLSGRTLLRILSTLDEYAASRTYTEVELHTMRKLWFEGWSVGRLALHDGVSTRAVRCRIEGTDGYGGLKKKAEKFYEWWSGIHKRATPH